MSDRPWKVTVKRSDTEMLDALERLVDKGACPGIVNDDNGHWAVSDEGTQNVVFGEHPEDVQTSFFVEASKFRSSIREAIEVYLDECDANGVEE